MKRIVLLFIFVLPILVEISAQNKFSLEFNYGLGHDFQTRSNDYNLTGPLIIPSPLESSILHIEKPHQLSISGCYQVNENVEILLGFGQISRALRYWSIDSNSTSESFENDKIGLKIKYYNIETGIRLKTNFDSKINLYWDQTLGVGFGKGSNRYTLTKDDQQAELLYLHNKQYAVLAHVEFENPIISLNSEIGMDYQLNRNLKMFLGLQFVNEISNGNNLIVWSYDLRDDEKGGSYNPYDLEFKSLYSILGLRFTIK